MCLLTDAQLFLNNISGFIGANMLYRAFIDKSQDVVDSYWKTQKTLFLDSFFGGNTEKQKDGKTLFYFVMIFNALILALHVKAKIIDSIFLPISPIPFPIQENCFNCKANEFEDDGDSVMCLNCGLFNRQCYAASWNDITRVYIAPIYKYNRRAQFKEYILQYQGKCLKIDYSILDKLLVPRKKKCSKKDFLDLLRLSIRDKFCVDHIHALYYKFFDIEPPKLAHITYTLITWFDKFFEVYNHILWQKKLTQDRYVSNQFLLYQFLNNNGVKTSLDDVLLTDSLPTNNQLLCNEIFNVLNWQMF